MLALMIHNLENRNCSFTASILKILDHRFRDEIARDFEANGGAHQRLCVHLLVLVVFLTCGRQGTRLFSVPKGNLKSLCSLHRYDRSPSEYTLVSTVYTIRDS